MKAIEDYSLPRFVDSSCRREPDFENPYPSITAICRQQAFAPHLFPNDIIVYTTIKKKWFSDESHYRLIAILEVIHREESHLRGKSWYTSKGYPVPSNCMVPGNPPLPFDKTAGDYKSGKDIKHFLSHSPEKKQLIGSRIIEKWDAGYMDVANKIGAFIVTRPIYINVTDPPKINESEILRIFKKTFTNTRTPNHISKEEFKELAKLAGIDFVNH